MLLRNKDQQEVVSNEKKDRRDFLQLETLATRMGLYRYVQFHINSFIFYSVSLFSFINIYIYIFYSGSRQYARVVVFSKAPLPNYRPDLDDKRPLREVCIILHQMISFLLF